MTICTTDPALSMNSHLVDFIVRVLGFDHWSFAQCMGKVGKFDFVVIGFHIFHLQSVFPGESEVSGLFLTGTFFVKIVFDVALGAYQSTHFLMRGLSDVFSHGFKCLNQSRTSDGQLHCFRIMTIRATDRVDDLGAHIREFLAVIFCDSHFTHESRYVCTFTGPASRWLRSFSRCHRRSYTQGFVDIVNCPCMAFWSIVIFRKCIPSP